MIDGQLKLRYPEVEWRWHVNTGAAATGEKSTKPMLAAIAVPTINPIKIEMDLINPLVKILTTRMIRIVIAARKRL